MGEEKLQALLQESLAVATRTEAMKPSDLARVVIDTTVQPKAVMFPTDAKLLNRARERLVRLAKKLGVSLRQSYRRVGKLALIKHQRYAHAHQFKPGNPYDGHTLGTVIPQMEALIGNVLDRCITDAGYRGHNAPPDHKFKVYTTGQKRRVTPQIKREFKRRAAIEPVIGHLKEHHRMGRNHLAHASGDAINAVLAAAGYNFRRLLAWLRFLLLSILIALGLTAQLKST